MKKYFDESEKHYYKNEKLKMIKFPDGTEWMWISFKKFNWTPENEIENAEAVRLLKFISYFLPCKDDDIPPTSILREFLGGSSFRY